MVVVSRKCEHRGSSPWKYIFWLLFTCRITPHEAASTRPTSAPVADDVTTVEVLSTVFATDLSEEEFATSNDTMALNEIDLNCAEGQRCRRKCCPTGQLFDTENFVCRNASEFILSSDYELENVSIVGSEVMREMWLQAKAQKNRTCGFFTEFDMRILNGFREESNKLNYMEDFFCTDKMLHSGETKDLRFACHVLFASKDRVTIEMVHILNSIHLPLQIVSFISISLLAFLLLMYLISPGNTDIQLKCTVCLASAMLLRLFLRLFYYMNREASFFDHRETCAFIGASRIYSYLCVSFWLNIMSYELSRVIRGSLRYRSLKELTKSKWRFPCYFVYSWITPGLICAFILALYLPPDLLKDSRMKPSFMPVTCLRNPFHLSTYIFAYGPIGLLFLMDTIFMLHIGYLLHREQILRFFKIIKTPAIQMRTHSSKNYLEWFKQRLYIYSLFVIMRIIKSLGMQSSNSTFFAVAVLLTMSDVLGSMLLFFIIVKSNNYILPKKCYARFSSIWEKIDNAAHPKDNPKVCSVPAKQQKLIGITRL